MQSWLNTHKFRPRAPRNLRKFDAAEEQQIMESYIMQRRARIRDCPKPGAEWSPDDGNYTLDRRFSRDQMGLELDTGSNMRTWATPEECSRNHVRVKTAGPGSVYYSHLSKV